jgi:hypothetical protein
MNTRYRRSPISEIVRDISMLYQQSLVQHATYMQKTRGKPHQNPGKQVPDIGLGHLQTNCRTWDDPRSIKQSLAILESGWLQQFNCSGIPDCLSTVEYGPGTGLVARIPWRSQ